jgi:hypothetical protein
VPRGRELAEKTEVLARAVAKSGSVEVCRFLRQRNFWKPWHEIHFLPIAAEYGHLEFAKFAVENGCDNHLKLTHFKRKFDRNLWKEIRYPADIRYFALYRSIVSGHLDIVRWLICEVGVPVHNIAELEQLEIVPMELAVGAGNKDMIALLEELHADRGTDFSPGLDRMQWEVSVVEGMSYYQDALCLWTDYKKNWIPGFRVSKETGS